mmetsp:Transcript_3780/g.4573  ORF Transcript_3780/g.4573 Transcript_3780/m.4573 type:complete len:301 (+) Transcript_3780:179-1081(+)
MTVSEVPFVAPLTLGQKEDWEVCRKHYESEGKLTRVEALEDEVIERFIFGSAFVKNPEKRRLRIIQTLDDYIQWADKINIGTVLLRQYSLAGKFRETLWPLKYFGKTDNGHAVFLLRLKECKLKKAASLFPSALLLEYITCTMEIMLHTLKSWKCNCRSIIIFDCMGMSMTDYYTAYKAGLSTILSLLGEYYPETLHKFYAINAPSIFAWCYGVMKPFIQPDTVRKINIIRNRKTALSSLKAIGVDLQRLPQDIFDDGVNSYDYLVSDEVIQLLENEEGTSRLSDILESIKTRQVTHRRG